MTDLVASKVVSTLWQEFAVSVEEVLGLLTAVNAEVSFDDFKTSNLVMCFRTKTHRVNLALSNSINIYSAGVWVKQIENYPPVWDKFLSTKYFFDPFMNVNMCLIVQYGKTLFILLDGQNIASIKTSIE